MNRLREFRRLIALPFGLPRVLAIVVLVSAPGLRLTGQDPLPAPPAGSGDMASQDSPGSLGEQTDEETVSGVEGAEATGEADGDAAVLEGDRTDADPAQEHWIDRYRDLFKSTVDSGANWVDGIAVPEGHEDEPENAYGRVSGNVYWQNREGFIFRGRFRIKVSLDSTSRRFNAMIGRGDPQDFIDDRYDTNSRFASFYRGSESDEFLAGVAYRPGIARSGSFSLGAGASFSSGINPYVSVNYRYRHVSKDGKFMAGVYQTFYYHTNDSFGSRTTIEPEYLISENWLIRNYSYVEFNDTILGTEWQSTFTLYQDLGRSRAIAYEVGAYGESGRDISLINYGVTVTYRQRMFRDWLFGEVTIGVAYPREFPDWERRGDPMIGFGVEFFFGDDR